MLTDLQDEVAECLEANAFEGPCPCIPLAIENERLQAENEKLREALIWCSGSADFAPGGQAYEGWLKIHDELLK